MLANKTVQLVAAATLQVRAGTRAVLMGTQTGTAVVPLGIKQLSLAKYVTCRGRERHLSYTCSLRNCQICL